MSDTRITLMEAIVRQQIVITRYNGQEIRLAPHLLFERHGDLFIGALNLDKNWREEDERRLAISSSPGSGRPNCSTRPSIPCLRSNPVPRAPRTPY